MGEISLAENVLFIGHSLVGPEMPVMLEDLVVSQGGTGRFRVQIINGAPLVWNWQHSAEAQGVDARKVLPRGETGAVVMTEAIPLAASITWSDTDDYAYKFFRLAERSRPGTKVFLYETWHSLDSGTGATVPDDENAGIPWRVRLDQDLPRWEGIVAAVNARAEPGDAPMRLIPAGQAMGRLDDEIRAGRVPGLTSVRQLFRDDIHPNNLGNYFVALVQYAALYGRNPAGLPFRLGNEWGQPFEAPTPKLAAKMQEVAWQAVRAYVQPSGRQAAQTGYWPDKAGPDALVPVRAALGEATPAPAAVVEPADPALAMGLNGISDWSTEQPFVDLMKSARPWTGHLPDRWDG